MPAKINPIPEGECAATPYLSVSNAAEMIDFYKKVFGAVETMRAGERSFGTLLGHLDANRKHIARRNGKTFQGPRQPELRITP